jgi:hypothetical protein
MPPSKVCYVSLTGGPPAYALLASHGPSDHELTLRTLFASKGWASSILQEGRKKLELKSGREVFCIEVDRDASGEGVARVYTIVVEAGYPTNFVFSAGAAAAAGAPPRAMAEFRSLALAALRTSAGASEQKQQKALKSALRASLKPLAERFSALETIDKLAAVQAKANDLKGRLVENLFLATERDGLLEALEEKTSKLRDSAATFEKGSTSARCLQRVLLLKWWLLGGVIVVIVVAAIAAGVTHDLGLW